MVSKQQNFVKRYRYAGIYAFVFAALATLQPLIGQYLTEIGFTGGQIGFILACGTAVSIGAGPFWGWRYHISQRGYLLVFGLCVSAALLSLALLQMKLFPLFLVTFGVFAFFQAPINPLTDTMTLEAKISYGGARKWGAIGYAIGVFAAGQIAEATGLSVIFYIGALFFLVAAAILIGSQKMMANKENHQPETMSHKDVLKELPTAELSAKDKSLSNAIEETQQGPKKKKASGYLLLVKNKKLVALLCSAFFIYGPNVAHNTYYGFLYKEMGGSIAGIGLSLLLMCASEAPFMDWAEHWSKKFTLEKLLLIAMVLSSIRYFWYSTGPAPQVLIGTFFFQGLINGIIIVYLIRYIAKLVEPSMISMAVTLSQAFSSNCSIILCQLIGGNILEHYGGARVYLFFSIYNVIGIFLYVSFNLHQSVEEKPSITS